MTRIWTLVIITHEESFQSVTDNTCKQRNLIGWHLQETIVKESTKVSLKLDRNQSEWDTTFQVTWTVIIQINGNYCIVYSHRDHHYRFTFYKFLSQNNSYLFSVLLHPCPHSLHYHKCTHKNDLESLDSVISIDGNKREFKKRCQLDNWCWWLTVFTILLLAIVKLRTFITLSNFGYHRFRMPAMKRGRIITN